MKQRFGVAAALVMAIAAVFVAAYHLGPGSDPPDGGASGTDSPFGRTGETGAQGGAQGGSRDAPRGSARGDGQGGPREGGGGRSRATLVVTRSVEEAVNGNRLRALGDGEAAASVTVVPRDTGVLREVAVRSGNRVTAGAVLARLDSEGEEIARDIAARAVSDAEATRARQAALARSQAGSRADLDAADNALARARLALREAELQLARRTLVAPITGTVGIVGVEPGDRVTSDTPIVTIDERATLRVDFRVPERFAGLVEIGQPVEATSFALPGRRLAGVVSAVGSRVEADSRTLPVQAEFDNADDRLRPGMSFSLELRFAGETLPAVDPLAVRWDSGGSHVWRVVAGKVQRTPVRIVRRDVDAVLVDAELAVGDEVVVEGLLSLRDGASVRVAGVRRSAPGGGPATDPESDAAPDAGPGSRERSGGASRTSTRSGT